MPVASVNQTRIEACHATVVEALEFIAGAHQLERLCNRTGYAAGLLRRHSDRAEAEILQPADCYGNMTVSTCCYGTRSQDRRRFRVPGNWHLGSVNFSDVRPKNPCANKRR